MFSASVSHCGKISQADCGAVKCSKNYVQTTTFCANISPSNVQTTTFVQTLHAPSNVQICILKNTSIQFNLFKPIIR